MTIWERECHSNLRTSSDVHHTGEFYTKEPQIMIIQAPWIHLIHSPDGLPHLGQDFVVPKGVAGMDCFSPEAFQLIGTQA